MKITDLISDCLEQCFGYLSIDDLLNVADSNQELRQVARNVYHRMHRQKLVCFTEIMKGDYLCKCCSVPRNDHLNLVDNMVVIRELKLALQFLRCFGDLVFTRMQFNFCTSDADIHSTGPARHKYVEAHEWEHLIVEYINKFCAETLRSLEIDGHGFNYVNCDLGRLTRPFANVVKLTTNMFLQTQKNVHELFPKVRELEMLCLDEHSTLAGVRLHNDFMVNRFPYLEHLRIDISDQYIFNKENFAIALRLNPQIKNLSGNIWFEVLFDANSLCLSDANELFRNLEKLDLKVNLRKPKVIDILKKPLSEELHLKNLKHLTIRCVHDRSNHDMDTTWTFPFTCEQLKSLTLSVSYCKLEQFSNLFNKHPTVKSVRFECNPYLVHNYTMTVNDCSIISKAFPLLEVISFKVATDEVVEAIKMFPSLKWFFCFIAPITNVVEFDRLVRSLNGWSVSTMRVFQHSLSDSTILLEGKRNDLEI